MDNKINVLEEFSINELEDRVEFSICYTPPSPCEDVNEPLCHIK